MTHDHPVFKDIYRNVQMMTSQNLLVSLQMNEAIVSVHADDVRRLQTQLDQRKVMIQ